MQSAREVLLERENLPAIAKRGFRKQAQLGERIKRHPHWLDPFDRFKQEPGRLGQLDLGSVEEGVLRLSRQLLLDRGQLHDLDTVQRPTMRRGHFFHLIARFG